MPDTPPAARFMAGGVARFMAGGVAKLMAGGVPASFIGPKPDKCGIIRDPSWYACIPVGARR